MESLYVLFSFLTSLGILLMIYSFYRDFNKITIGGLAPMIIGTIQGFMSR